MGQLTFGDPLQDSGVEAEQSPGSRNRRDRIHERPFDGYPICALATICAGFVGIYRQRLKTAAAILLSIEVTRALRGDWDNWVVPNS